MFDKVGFHSALDLAVRSMANIFWGNLQIPASKCKIQNIHRMYFHLYIHHHRHEKCTSQGRYQFSCTYQMNHLLNLFTLARLRRPPAAFLLNRAITRGANSTKTFPWLCQSYMQSFIKIGVPVFEKNGNKIVTFCNSNKDTQTLFWQQIPSLAFLK